MTAGGYRPEYVLMFLKENGTQRDDGTFITINDVRLNESQRGMPRRWEHWNLVPLGKLDAFLMGVDLMLFEFEHWAELHDLDAWVEPTPDLRKHRAA